MTDYHNLDTALIENIKAGKNEFYCINSGAAWKEAERLSNLIGRPEYRIVDVRLRALRKAGIIAFTKAGWIP